MIIKIMVFIMLSSGQPLVIVDTSPTVINMGTGPTVLPSCRRLVLKAIQDAAPILKGQKGTIVGYGCSREYQL